MRASLITGCLMSACLFAAALPASRPAAAADFGGEGYTEPPYDEGAYADDEGYDDERAPPRYDRYGEAPPPDRYGDAYDDGRGEPPPGSIKDGYPVPMPPSAGAPPPSRYVERPAVGMGRHACLDRWQIRQKLRRHGWTDVQPMGGDGDIVRIRAGRFDSSSVFRLRVDRCSGEVLAARPISRDFAYRDRRWDRRDW